MSRQQIGNIYGVITPFRSATQPKVIRLTQGASGGNNFQLLVGTTLTANIARTATAAAVQTALRALPQIGSAGVTCSGGPLGTSPVDCTLGGKLAAVDLPLPVFVNVDLTGGVVAVAQQTALATEGYNNANLASIEDVRAVLAIAGYSTAYMDKMSFNDLMFMYRQVAEPWNLN